jgi:hypothetical protein
LALPKGEGVNCAFSLFLCAKEIPQECAHARKVEKKDLTYVFKVVFVKLGCFGSILAVCKAYANTQRDAMIKDCQSHAGSICFLHREPFSIIAFALLTTSVSIS